MGVLEVAEHAPQQDIEEHGGGQHKKQALVDLQTGETIGVTHQYQQQTVRKDDPEAGEKAIPQRDAQRGAEYLPHGVPSTSTALFASNHEH